jgi:hypothetical protein
MSRGPGIVQRKLLSLMAKNRHGAWNTRKLRGLVYDDTTLSERAKLISINRALNSMTLPDGWRYEQRGTRYHYLYNANSEKSRRELPDGG